MAKYVLLQFNDDAQADRLIAALQEWPEAIDVSGEITATEPEWYRVVGVQLRGIFKLPTKFCECTNLKRRGFTRGKKYGWWVCDQCRRPTKAWGRLEGIYQFLGFNLLPKDDNAPEYRGDGNWIPHNANSGRTSTQPPTDGN